jgi:dihydroneopterin aldolase
VSENRTRRDRIELRGIRAVGIHGVLASERERAQPFGVDIDLVVDLRAAGRSDDLADTVDYAAVTEAVVDVVAGPSVALLECLAERVADRVLSVAGSRAQAVTITIHKLRPPVPVDMVSAGVRITRP